MESFDTWKQNVDYDRDEQNKYRNCDFNPGTHVDRTVKCMMLIILTYACALYSKSRASVGFKWGSIDASSLVDFNCAWASV